MKTLSQIAKKRLNALADYLERHSSVNKHFDMDAWFAHNGYATFDKEHGIAVNEVIPKNKIHTCGSTACALGWACQVPALRNTGLMLVYLGNDHGEIRLKGSSINDPIRIAQKVFDISRMQAKYLFTPLDLEQQEDSNGECTFKETPKYWSDRCRLFISVNGDIRNLALPR